MTSAIQTAIKPTRLCSVSAIHLYSADGSHNTVCTRDFLCVLSFKSYFLDRTTTSRKDLNCKLFPGSYQKHHGKTIKKLSNRIRQAV